MRITKLMKINEIHVRITKIIKILQNLLEKHGYHENQRDPFENHENHKILNKYLRITRE